MFSEKKLVLNIALPVPFRKYFDYLPTADLDLSLLKPGVRVLVPFQRRKLVGIFMGMAEHSEVPENKLKSIIKCIDIEPIVAEDVLKLCLWAGDYYHFPIGEILQSSLPGPLKQGKPAILKKVKKLTKDNNPLSPLTLNPNQQSALTAIQSALGKYQTFLLAGVTGSGKTEVYLQTIATVLERGEQALVLVPEIGLTPQTIQRFKERFAVPIVTFHSGMTENQRLQSWLAAQQNEAKIIIGTRSAVFTPFAKLGVIIVDEEHDLSFKQQDSFRYHARNIAVMRAYSLNIPIVLGSATPSLETLHQTKLNRYRYLCLPERAGIAQPPQFKVVDIRNVSLDQGLSASLLAEMKQHLQKGEQVILFLNRRGFAPVLMCHGCGWLAMCKRCDARLTYHQAVGRLQCHHCDKHAKVMIQCEACQSAELIAIGQGTERLESVLTKYFPEYSIARIDRDTTRKKGTLEQVLKDIQSGKHQILIGTQMLAKGHHFPNVTLVAIVDADAGFFSGDFRSLERMGQLLLQVSGRAGRNDKLGKVVIQTHHPDHPLLMQLLQDNYQLFAASLLQERAQAQLPPYVHFALFRTEAHNVNNAEAFLQEVKNLIMTKKLAVQILGPIAAPMPRRAGKFRMQLLLQALERATLQKLLKSVIHHIEVLPAKNKVRWSLDVDPLEMY